MLILFTLNISFSYGNWSRFDRSYILLHPKNAKKILKQIPLHTLHLATRSRWSPHPWDGSFWELAQPHFLFLPLGSLHKKNITEIPGTARTLNSLTTFMGTVAQVNSTCLLPVSIYLSCHILFAAVSVLNYFTLLWTLPFRFIEPIDRKHCTYFYSKITCFQIQIGIPILT